MALYLVVNVVIAVAIRICSPLIGLEKVESIDITFCSQTKVSHCIIF